TTELNNIDSHPSVERGGTPLSGELINVNIGSLPAGKTITIVYQATVNTPAGARQVSTQGTVTGSNFTLVNGISTTPNTDDPETGAAHDATITNINTTLTWAGGSSTDW